MSSRTVPNVGSGSAATRLVEFVRLTAFLGQGEQPSEPTWWTDLTGNQPDERTSRPSKNEFQATGPFGDNTLVLSVQLGRVDWFMTPQLPQLGTNSAGEIRSIGIFPDAFSDFVGLMRRWLSMAPSMVRLAFGAVLLEQVQNKEDGYRRLSEYLPSVAIDPVGSEDFNYQVNRPRVRTIAGQELRINRLSKWSVALFQQFMLPVGSARTTSAYVGNALHVCRVELDISTPATFPGSLPSSHLPEILLELVSLASEIGLRGDFT